MNRIPFLVFCVAFVGCSGNGAKEQPPPAAAVKEYFKVDSATAGAISGTVRFAGRKPARKLIEMDSEPECVRLHKGKPAEDETIVVGSRGALANVFLYLKAGMEGRNFEVPAEPVTIDQKGCWFEPRVVGIQTGQTFRVTNSDPVTHNIHPLAQLNREWNQSQGQGDPPLMRKFTRPEILLPVKCNIHRWMRALIGVVDHPYFAVTGADGTFEIKNVPPGTYTVAAVHESLGTQEQPLTLAASGKGSLEFTFKGE
jgi:plastocyanin